ncbi:PREDICTED: chorion peroxidase, partial [Nicrophorus vespilloides]|uniref:Chorion peroxidase n=1 Tax=Nicrophorus vespilloides TaxID=110193 RepID=A0ABM1MW02_NICVS
IWLPRVSEDQGQPLNSPRIISTALFPDGDVPNREITLMLMQYGQFLSHDITQSIDSTFVNGSAISCCTPDGSLQLPPHIRHFACMPIYIPPKDPFFSFFKQGCMNFVRSVMAPRSDCTLGYAQQMNKVTHFVDGSSVYGSTPEQTAELRSFQGGMLKVFVDFGRELLPLSKDPEACITQEQGSACFESGDSRTNQMISLVALHTLFMREHNRLARELGRINSRWSDQKIFLEARRILTAEMQVVTYKEFLPALLGEAAMKEFDIGLKEFDYSYDYDQRVEPSVTNEFASAAFRFGHSTVEGLLKIYGVDKMDEMISLPETMFYPGRMRKHLFYDQLLSTLTTEPIQEVDNLLSESLTKYMFRAGNPFGVDLASLNIQRGRDHGLRPYNDYRQLVGQARYTSFKDFGAQFGPKLASVYSSVDDVDLWVGGLLESKHAGSILGVTFRDIIADQFFRLKKGDKYFFDHDPSVNPSHFTLEQLQSLRKSSLSRMICDNSDGFLLARQALNAFKLPGVPGNEFHDCNGNEIPRINLMLWQDFE